ncbi:MAG: hypothetical protein ACRCWF_00140 [Beijerinckiaceae bacterium]
MSMIPADTMLTSRVGNGPFGFLFQSDAAGSLMAQCGVAYAVAAVLVLSLAFAASRAEHKITRKTSI